MFYKSRNFFGQLKANCYHIIKFLEKKKNLNNTSIALGVNFVPLIFYIHIITLFLYIFYT